MRSSGSWIQPIRSRAASFHRRPTTSGGARRVHSHRCAGGLTSAMFEPRLPFEEDDHPVRLNAETVRLKADTTEILFLTSDAADSGDGSVRLEPDDLRARPDLADA